VAILAGVRRADVRRIFSRSADTIVARRTVTRDAGVIELSVTPRVGTMAIFTCVRTLDVGCGFPLSYSPIVARAAGT
jgi:hypothetical protein